VSDQYLIGSGVASRPHLASVLRESWESPNMHAGSGGDGNKIAHRLNLNTV
jgi:hypothetical protein